MFQNSFSFVSFLVPLFAFSLAFICLIKNHQSHIAVLYFLHTMAVGIWGMGLFLLFIVKNETQAIYSNYILNIGASLIPILFFHFVSAFLLRVKKDKILIITGYIVAFIFVILTFIPPLLIGGVSEKTSFRFWIDSGTFYLPFVVYFWFFVLIAVYLLIKGYKSSDGLIKKKIFYILLAVIIGFGGGGTNFLPQLFNVFPFGHYLTFLYPIIIAYGVFFKKY